MRRLFLSSLLVAASVPNLGLSKGSPTDPFRGFTGGVVATDLKFKTYNLDITARDEVSYTLRFELDLEPGAQGWPSHLEIPFRWFSCSYNTAQAEGCPLEAQIPEDVKRRLQSEVIQIAGQKIACEPFATGIVTSVSSSDGGFDGTGICRFPLPETLPAKLRISFKTHNPFQTYHGPVRGILFTLLPKAERDIEVGTFQLGFERGRWPFSWHEVWITPKSNTCLDCTRIISSLKRNDFTIGRDFVVQTTLDTSDPSSGKESYFKTIVALKDKGLSLSAGAPTSTPHLGKLSYGASNVFDSNLETAWCYPASTSKKDQHLDLLIALPAGVKESCQMRGLLVASGYRKSFKVFTNNGIPSKYVVTDCDDGSAVTDQRYFGVYDSLWEWAFFRGNKLEGVESWDKKKRACLRLAVLEWRADAADKPPQDVCISEIVPMMENCQ